MLWGRLGAWAERKGFRRGARARKLDKGRRPVVRVNRFRRGEGWFGEVRDAGGKVWWRAERR